MIEQMNLRRETLESSEQGDVGNVGHPSSSAAISRKRIIGVFLLVFGVLMLTASAYYWSTYSGRTHWMSFWTSEVIAGVLVGYLIVQVLRKKPRL